LTLAPRLGSALGRWRSLAKSLASPSRRVKNCAYVEFYVIAGIDMKNISNGIQTFSDIIKNDLIYADKTNYIEKMIDMEKTFFLPVLGNSANH
jgi:hypothetical protein